MIQPSLLPALRGVLEAIRERQPVDDVVGLVLEKACHLANGAHGSFVLVDYESRRLNIAQVFGSDWTEEKRLCRLAIGDGLTGIVAATGTPLLCQDTRLHPGYYSLFDYVRSELVVPVMVRDKVWGLINIDGAAPHAFDETALQLLTVFAELTAFAITLRLDLNEQEKLHQKLLQSEKLASLGEALAGIAHEINNPLTSILGCASLLEIGGDTKIARDAIEIIRSETLRTADLIKGILEFSRKETGLRERVDINTIVRETIGLKKFQLRSNEIELLVSYSDTACPVMVCPQQIKQVLLNLITNAQQAMPRGHPAARISVSVTIRGDRAVLIIGDTGGGIPLAAQKMIFDPFFTTKVPGQGTGLGLSIVHSIMEAHGGDVRLTSSTPKGTVFTLDLPLADSAADPPPAPAESTPPKRELRGRVLVVDDESHILDTLSVLLTALRLEVRSASHASVALQILQKERFDVIVSDMRMPGMDGIQFYEEASRIDSRYEKRFILMGGYLMSDPVRNFIASKGIACLDKPFPLEEFKRILEPFLAAPQADFAPTS